MTKQTNKQKGGNKPDNELYIQLIVIGILLILGLYFAGKISGEASSEIGIVSASEITPVGIPAIYGKELGVSYDDVSPNNPRLADSTISKLRQYEDIKLGEDMEKRYISIGYSISCEYCCGAKALIFKNGQRACGCAHSYAMRGLAKYLLKNHPDMSNEEILSELGKWKTLFFPGILEKKAQVLKNNGINSTSYINLASNKYRGIEKKQLAGSAVGEC